MKQFESTSIDVAEIKEKSQFLREALGFVKYERGEIEGTDKAFLLLAIDLDKESNSALSFSTITGDTKALLIALLESFHNDSPIKKFFSEALEIMAMRKEQG